MRFNWGVAFSDYAVLFLTRDVVSLMNITYLKAMVQED